jgi:translation initiation factor 1
LSQVAPVQDDAIEPGALHHRFEGSSDTFDFGQFRHGVGDRISAWSGILRSVSDRNARPVYSTGAGSICPKCGWPVRDCRCSTQFSRDEPLPSRIVAKLRMERAGRGGKTVTVVYDLPNNQAFLKELAGELKRACGTGGAAVDNTVEIQGDLRERIRGILEKKGWIVKG